MDPILESVASTFLIIVTTFFNSSFFAVIKFFLAIYVAVLFVDLILLLIVRGLEGNINTAIKGTNMPSTPKKKMQKRWMTIEDRLKSKESTQYKLAILEADGLTSEILSGIGYEGKNMTEKLEGVTEQQLSDVQLLRETHAIRNEIISNRNFFIDEEHSKEAINAYKRFLENIEII